MNKNVNRVARCPCGRMFETAANRDVFCSLRCRFFSEVEVRGEDECWPWLGAKDKDGYGHFRYQYRMYSSNRAALEIANGPLGKDVQALHHCDNPPCCNRKHIWGGTNVDNVKDRHQKGRTKTNPRSGDNGRNAKRDKFGRFQRAHNWDNRV